MAGFSRKPIQPIAIDQALAAADAAVPAFPSSQEKDYVQTSPAAQDFPQPVAQPASQAFVARAQLLASEFSVSSFVVGQVYDVPLRLIASNPVNPRAIYTTNSVDEMAISLREHGQRISATGYVDASLGIVLIEGETRFRAARQTNIPTLRIEIKEPPKDERSLYEEARSANVDRKNQSPLDDAIVWKGLLNRKVYPSQKALGIANGVEEDVVSRTLSLSNLSQKLLNAIAEYPDLNNLRMLVALREYADVVGDDEKTMEILYEVAKFGLGSREVTSRRIALQQLKSGSAKNPIKKPRSEKEEVAFKTGKGAIRQFEKGGRVELSIKGLTPEESTELMETLRKIFLQNKNVVASS